MKRKLETTLDEDYSNEIWAEGPVGPNGANPCYMIRAGQDDTVIMFSRCNKRDPECVYAVTEWDLLEVIKDRLKGIQSGDYACDYVGKALYHIEEALGLLVKREEDRIKRTYSCNRNK